MSSPKLCHSIDLARSSEDSIASMHPRTLIAATPGRPLLLLTSLAACGTNGAGQPATTDAARDTHTASDFVPPTGRAAAPRSESAGEYRILLARSDDGSTFTRTGKVLTDQANVPSLVAREDSIFAYYTGEGIDAQGRETLAVARSADHGENWTFHRVRLSGFQSDPPPVDPDVVLSSSGEFVLYVTQGSGPLPAIHWGTSSDGVSFAYGGIAFRGSEQEGAIDSLTMSADGGGYWMFTLRPTGFGFLRARSSDGRTFTQAGSLEPLLDGKPYVLSNALRLPDGTTRIFATNPEIGIRSFSIDAHGALTGEPGVRLPHAASGLESAVAKDAAVARTSRGYLMAYVSKIPVPGADGTQP